MPVSRAASVLNLDKFGFASPADLLRLGDSLITVKLSLGPFPSVRRLAPLTPRERGEAVRAHFRRLFRALRPLLPENAASTDREFRDCVCNLPARSLSRLLRHPSVRHAWLEGVSGRRRRPSRLEPVEWYGVLARFAIQVEGVTRGLEGYEDRVVIVRARSFTDAEHRLEPEFRRYGSPYLGSSNRLVRWRFERVLDVYHIGPLDLSKGSAEVFSQLGKRRLPPGSAWTTPATQRC
jgi:hypothetical protein